MQLYHFLFIQDVDNEEYWENLADLSGQQSKQFNYSPVIPQLKSKILAFKAQVTGWNHFKLNINRFSSQQCYILSSLFDQLSGGVVEEVQQIHQPLKVLQNLILRRDLDKSYHRELGLPRVLFELIHDAVENKDFIKVIAHE